MIKPKLKKNIIERKLLKKFPLVAIGNKYTNIPEIIKIDPRSLYNNFFGIK